MAVDTTPIKPEAKMAKGRSVSSLKLFKNKASVPTEKLEIKKPIKAPKSTSKNTLPASASSALNMFNKSFFK